MSSESYHEPIELLSETTKNIHRAIVSLMEELEAVDWYQQRAEACSDQELRAVLIHNKNEEIEHAMMTLEWIRRNSAEFDENARTYLFKSGSITGAEEAATEGGSAPGDGEAKGERGGGAKATGDSLGIGSLKGDSR